MNAELGGPMRDHEERATDAAMACCPDVGLPGHHPDNCRVCRDIAAALRSAEESAARRCAEIVCVYCEMAKDGTMGWLDARVNGGEMHRNMKTGRYARCRGHAIRSEFGLNDAERGHSR